LAGSATTLDDGILEVHLLSSQRYLIGPAQLRRLNTVIDRPTDRRLSGRACVSADEFHSTMTHRSTLCMFVSPPTR